VETLFLIKFHCYWFQLGRGKFTKLISERDGKLWVDRLKEEYLALIKYIEVNKQEDNDWVKIEATNKEQTS
jgi:hypothetical protein